MSQPVTPTVSVHVVTSSRRGTVRRLLSNPLGVISLAVIAVAVLASVLAPVVAPYNPDATDLSNVLAGPSAAHWFGTDSVGRDVLSRLLHGGQVTFAAAALATLVALVIGVPAGLVAGYYGGRFDAVSYWLSDMLMSLPGIIILLAARAALGPSVWYSMVIFGVLFSPSFYRLVRTSVISVRHELYVDAAKVSGLPDIRIIGRHVLYVVRAPIIIQAALIAGIAIAVQAGLEFLGLGDQSVPSWGMMLNEGFRNVFLSPGFLVWPAGAIALVTGALALLGNALRDALEDGEKAPRQRRVRDARRAALSAAEEQEEQEEHEQRSVDDGHLLSVRGLTIEYPGAGGGRARVVDDVSFHVDRGEVLGIVGESGSGKTQTAFAVLGLLPDDADIVAGRIVIDGIEVVGGCSGRNGKAIEPLRGVRIGYVPQEPMSNLDPAFTIGYQLARPLIKRKGMSKAQARRRALELLEIVGIPEPERTFAAYPHEISGGMAQRVLIAGAVGCEPDLLIADEPTTALDVTVQAEVLDLLRDLQQRLGMGVVLVTHNFGVVADICDRIVVMKSSRVVESGEVRAVLREPSQAYTAELLASTLEGKPRRTMLLDTPTEGTR
ncbi:dipeptide/oligopeptide/nickel ABC transporter permease/ATP-binding protein [Microbacterium sp. 18062]|uniref:dipeptide/oligopeptide/nickel ABC transporter permease/ATP-binding protein n=1 Tax=Microbacterium sp. 18062 TaxID=2681410 RepID=UPI001356EB89|nr:dipeptide/oligopeptide/nickel ABC transporter permease/ATP-binding protein [Microbacterium sp. 18062]